jgi:hypothetical protein
VEVGHFQAKFIGHFSPHIFPHLAARISRKLIVAKVGKHLYYMLTTAAFSAQGAWPRETGTDSWNVQYGDSTISHKAERCFLKHKLKDPKGKEEKKKQP